MKKLALYVHIPFCVKKCNYCNFYSIDNYAFEDGYCECVSKQIERESKNFEGYCVETIYFGGGTPSSINAKNIQKILLAIKDNFNCDLEEVSIECNPNSLTDEKIEKYLSLGINRFSVGIQSMSNDTLIMLGRKHSVDDCHYVMKALKKHNVQNFNVDYILGTLSANFEDEKRFLDFVSKYDIPHVSAYALKVEESTPLYNMVKLNQVKLNDDDLQVDEYDYLVENLNKLGIIRYETSNFAKIGFECKHNLAYWDLTEYLGVGTKAHSFHHNKRVSIENSICDYIDSIKKSKNLNTIIENLEQDSLMFEYVMLALRTKYGVVFERFRELFSKDFDSVYGERINQNKQYFNVTQQNLTVKDECFYVLNSILLKIL